MNRRGIIIISTLFGLFALCFGVLGVRALTLGPDPGRPTANEMVARTEAANRLATQIRNTQADAPPALPPVPERVATPVTYGTAGTAGATATRAPMAAPEREYEDEDEYEGGEYEGEDEEEYEEGDGDDD